MQVPIDRAELNQLMDRASRADGPAAFGALASRVQDELYRLALAQGLAPHDAADATQEALLRAYAGREGWREGADALAWLCGIAINVCRELRRRRSRTPAAESRCEGLRGLAAASGDAAHEQAWGPEQTQRLAQALEALPPRQREAIACRYLRRMTVAETAAAMGCAVGTVKSAVWAGLERLKQLLQRARPEGRESKSHEPQP
jgi:RNA polymerase sigma-70 factor (ECF subfamily)